MDKDKIRPRYILLYESEIEWKMHDTIRMIHAEEIFSNLKGIKKNKKNKNSHGRQN